MAVHGWTRRELLRSAALAAGGLALPLRLRAQAAGLDAAARQAIQQSPLVYVSPLRRDGQESRCHAEMWFVPDGDDLLVVTTRQRWRARAIRAGLHRARLWVGDFGVWTEAKGRFRSAPSFVAEASLVPDVAVRQRALSAFGAKYARDWAKWGPRFRKGLADGSRVLIRYRPQAS